MKYFVCSDIHGNVRALQAVLAVYRREFPCEFLFLGDCVGYGAHPDACIEIVTKLPRAHLVLGNHDAAILRVGEREDMNEIAAEALAWTRARLDGPRRDLLRRRFAMEFVSGHCLAVHASPYRPEEWYYVLSGLDAEQAFFAREFAVGFVGHTHSPALWISGGGERPFVAGTPVSVEAGERYLFNPGSVGQPRDGDPRAACCVFDAEAGTVTLHRCSYDMKAESDDMIAAGLPRYLADRILHGV